MYHSINTQIDGVAPDLVVHPDNFAKQLRYLKTGGYQFGTVSEVVSGKVPQTEVAQTFDDGFEDNYTHLFPLLRPVRRKRLSI